MNGHEKGKPPFLSAPLVPLNMIPTNNLNFATMNCFDERNLPGIPSGVAEVGRVNGESNYKRNDTGSINL